MRAATECTCGVVAVVADGVLFEVVGTKLATDFTDVADFLFFNSLERAFNSFALAVGSVFLTCLQSAWLVRCFKLPQLKQIDLKCSSSRSLVAIPSKIRGCFAFKGFLAFPLFVFYLIFFV
jgi:hypothetical protein